MHIPKPIRTQPHNDDINIAFTHISSQHHCICKLLGTVNTFLFFLLLVFVISFVVVACCCCCCSFLLLLFLCLLFFVLVFSIYVLLLLFCVRCSVCDVQPFTVVCETMPASISCIICIQCSGGVRIFEFYVAIVKNSVYNINDNNITNTCSTLFITNTSATKNSGKPNQFMINSLFTCVRACVCIRESPKFLILSSLPLYCALFQSLISVDMILCFRFVVLSSRYSKIISSSRNGSK